MNMIASIVALILAAAFSNQAGTSAPPPSQSQPDAATTTFHSDVLHFDYTYSKALIPMAPSETADAIQAAKNEVTGVAKAAIDCVTDPLAATDSKGGVRVLVILRLNGTCLGAAPPASILGTTVTSTLSQSLSKFGTPQMGASADYQVAGHSASAVSGTVKSDQLNVTFFGSASCLLHGSDVVCWEFIASDCARVPEMMKYPVAFEGKDPEAVIPAKFAQACK